MAVSAPPVDGSVCRRFRDARLESVFGDGGASGDAATVIVVLTGMSVRTAGEEMAAPGDGRMMVMQM